MQDIHGVNIPANNAIPKFTGDYRENPSRWQKDMMEVLELIKVPNQGSPQATQEYLDRMKRYVMKQGLTGEALTWFQDLGDQPMFPAIWFSFTRKYLHGDIPYYSTKLLEKLKQKEDESAGQFAMRLK